MLNVIGNSFYVIFFKKRQCLEKLLGPLLKASNIYLLSQGPNL